MKKILRFIALAVVLTALFSACQNGGVHVHSDPEPSSTPTQTPSVSVVTPTPVTPTPVTPTPVTPTPVTPTPVTPTPVTPTPVTPTPVTPTPVTPTPVDPDKTRPEDYEPFYPTEKVVAFTFDDGPCWVTPQILDVLEGTGDKVTFFIVGEMMDKNKKDYPAYVKRAYDMGCDIGSHTENHQTLTKLSDTELAEQLGRNQARFNEITGDNMYLMRPPGGSLDRNRKYGYASVIWSLDSDDWEIYGRINKNYKNIFGNEGAFKNPHSETYEKAAKEVVDELVANVLKKVQPGDIVLMHDIYFTSARAFKEIYTALKAQGYRFVTVSEMLNINAAEYDGWYFFSTRAAGHDNKTYYAKKPASAPAFALALLPNKEDED